MKPIKGLSQALGAATGSAPAMPKMSKMPMAPPVAEETQEGGDLQQAMSLMQQAMDIISSYTDEEGQTEAEYE